MFRRYVFLEGLTSLFGSDGKFLINNDGQIKDIKGNDLPITYDENGYGVVHCSGWDGERDYRVIDLIAIQFKDLHIPISEYNKIISFVIDGNPHNTRASNIGYRFKNGPLEYKVAQGYFYVPGFTMLAINKNGSIISTRNGRHIPLCRTKPDIKRNSKGGYYVGACSSENLKGRIPFARHRCICLTFKDYPDNVDSLIVNHKNGIPGDDEIDNLEWTTRGQNNTHAYTNDLKNQHKRVLVRDVLTGSVREYYSISECSRALGYATDETIRQRLVTSKFGQVFQEGVQVKYKDDTREWIIPTDPQQEIKNAQQKKPIIARNCATGDVISFSSIREASAATGVLNCTIEYRLKEDNRAPLFGYQFKLLDDPREFPDYTEQEYLSSLKENSFQVEARNLLSMETMEFSSIREASQHFHIGLNQSLVVGKQPLLDSGWQIKFKKDPWVDSRDFDEQMYKATRDIMAREEITGKIIIAREASVLAAMLNLDRKSVRKAAFTRGNQIYNGYRFRLGATLDPWPETNIVFKTRN